MASVNGSRSITTTIQPSLKRKIDDLDINLSGVRVAKCTKCQSLEQRTEESSVDGSPLSEPKLYDVRSSIILVGLAGAGKKTLAAITTLVTERKYVDFQKFFEQQASKLPAVYLRTHGTEAYRNMMNLVAEELFKTHGQDYVIGGLDEVNGGAYKDFLMKARQRNPIIYIRRTKDELRKYFASEDAIFEQWYRARDVIHDLCATHHFYNLHCHGANERQRGTLKLKDAETDFVAFLQRVHGGTKRLLHSNPPFSPTFTYALKISLSWLETCQNFELLDGGADAINLMIDRPIKTLELHDRLAKQMAVLRRHSRALIILEALYELGEEVTYREMLDFGIKCLPDMIAIDLRYGASDIMSSLPSNVEVIGCFALNKPWSTLYEHDCEIRSKLKQMPCRALRIVYEGPEILDNLAPLSISRFLTQRYGIPVIAYNAGAGGKSSICLNPVLSPVVAEGTNSAGFTAKEAQMSLYASYLQEKKDFVIIGKSVSYSLSPDMHNAGYEASGMLHKYTYHQTDNFSDIHQLISNKNCAGIAVTLPYKTDALGFLEHVSPEAEAIGAVNTIRIKRTGTSTVLEGHNTDHMGIRQCIYQNLSPANSIRSTTSCLIIGAGGMARAAIFACRAIGIKNFCIYNRTYENALALAESSSLDISVCTTLEDDWPARFAQPTVVVSTVPNHDIDGSSGFDMELPEKWLRSRTGGVFIELAYKPLVTGLLTQVRSLSSQGWIAVDGLEVLLEQGIAQFEIFTGRPAPVHVMRRIIQERRETLTRGE